jgi:transcriptional regulator with XRE-family HTH domain
VGADDSPAYQRRTLGRRLRVLRTAARLTFEEAYDRLEMSDTTLNRIERGTTGVGVHAVKSMLDLYGVGAQEWEPILALVREANRKGWWAEFGLTNRSYVAMETAASVVRSFDFGYIHGLLQTEEYMKAVSADSLSAEQTRHTVAIRRIRQCRLVEGPDLLKLMVVVDESAVRRLVGGRAVMRTQLLHLLDMADFADVRVLPLCVGSHVGMHGSFAVLDFPDPDEPAIGYFEHVVRATFVTRTADVERCRLAWEHLRSQALGAADSRALLRRILGEL